MSKVHKDPSNTIISFHPSGILSWWYSVAAPPEPAITAPLAERELARRGRITSLIMLLAVIMVVYALILVPSLQIAIVTAVISILDLIAVLIFNRRGKIIIAGLVITALAEVGIMGSTISDIALRGGVDLATLPFLALLIQGIIFGGSTLPGRSVFVIFFINTAFMLVLFFGLPHTHLLDLYFHSSYVFRNMACIFTSIYIVSAWVTYIWVQSTNNAIKRADRAEDLARLHSAIASANQQAAAQKADLERGVNELVQIISLIANHPEQELKINRQNVLWQIVVALDNLRKRVIHRKYEYNQLRSVQAAAAAFVTLLDSGNLNQWQQTGTLIDEIALRIKSIHVRTGHNPIPTWELSPPTPASDELRETLQRALQMFDE